MMQSHEEHFSQSSPNMEHNEAKLIVQLQTEEFMKTSMMESFQDTSESQRQAAQELAAFSSS